MDWPPQNDEHDIIIEDVFIKLVAVTANRIFVVGLHKPHTQKLLLWLFRCSLSVVNTK